MRTGHSVWGNIKKIAADPWFRLVIVCMSCIQTGFNTFYYGVLSSLERTGFTFGFNVFLVGLHEFIGYSLAGSTPLIQAYILPICSARKAS